MDRGVSERRRVRAEILEQIPLAQGEHVLSILCDVAGNWLVPTERSLYQHADHSWTRIGWEQVTRVHWDESRNVLELAVLTPQRPRPIALQLTESSPLVELARERVASTILLTTHVSLGDRGGARVRARRAPGSEQTVWQVTLDRHVDPSDSAIVAEIETALRELSGTLGA
ncbi:hypothetical protein [Phytoactinopolyspora halotolerans]|uniref:Uncharacterized protein n=1 Tax=Phytoactinopolyspora halotolerans TaxID=1981512 RepID=A0A6L9SDG7_9ACTN|nr:hypothetical protein [Phytoactinopolyspora halotolerans]NEE02612.1 hypothetical protein [Phytoactinopolyspora halotolerans]